MRRTTGLEGIDPSRSLIPTRHLAVLGVDAKDEPGVGTGQLIWRDVRRSLSPAFVSAPNYHPQDSNCETPPTGPAWYHLRNSNSN